MDKVQVLVSLSTKRGCFVDCAVLSRFVRKEGVFCGQKSDLKAISIPGGHSELTAKGYSD